VDATDPIEMRTALAAITFPATVVFEAVDAQSCGNDHVTAARCSAFTMDSAVLGLSSGCDCCTVRVFRLKSTLEDAIGFHAFAPLQANMRVTNGILLGCSLLLPFDTVNPVQTLKVNLTRKIAAEDVPAPGKVERAMRAVKARYPAAALVELTHFIGGPCHDSKITTCMVLGGGGCGWTFKTSLQEAIVLAHGRAVQRCGAHFGSQLCYGDSHCC
jgi:hypothetical protein